ncbi:MAG: folate-binding protein YgfZ [Polyangiaceae bacterium]|nr:folate-binding protein YgfZ [Polyangiaceae bacterium]
MTRDLLRCVRRSDLGTLVVEGADRVGWLNGVVTCDVREVAPGRGAWGLALTKQGKILTDVVVVASRSSLLLGVAVGSAATLAAHLEGLIVMEDATVRDASGEFAWWSLHGAGAPAVAAAAGPTAGAGSVPWTSLGDAVVVASTEDAATVEAALLEAGAALAVDDEWDQLRVAEQLPRFGRDYTAAENAHDASLEHRAVSWTKGCYLGQEVVCMQDMRGRARRRVVGLAAAAESASAVVPGAPLFGAGGAEVGAITSVTRPSAGVVLAIGHVQAALAEPGTVLTAGGAEVRVRPR